MDIIEEKSSYSNKFLEDNKFLRLILFKSQALHKKPPHSALAHSRGPTERKIKITKKLKFGFTLYRRQFESWGRNDRCFICDAHFKGEMLVHNKKRIDIKIEDQSIVKEILIKRLMFNANLKWTDNHNIDNMIFEVKIFRHFMKNYTPEERKKLGIPRATIVGCCCNPYCIEELLSSNIKIANSIINSSNII